MADHNSDQETEQVMEENMADQETEETEQAMEENMNDWDSDDYFYEPTPLFEATFLCRPFSDHPTAAHLVTGDKIIMPSSSFERLYNSGVDFPFLFRFKNPISGNVSHCGVLQFCDGQEGFVYMPEWMMQNLNLENGGRVVLRATTLSRGYFMKLRPHKTAFIEISDPKAVLEKNLREFSCLSQGDTIRIKFNEKDFYLDVLEVRPGDAVSLIDTDCVVDFAEPLDFKEKEVAVDKGKRLPAAVFGGSDHHRKEDVVKKVDDGAVEEEKKFMAFSGKGRRLDGGPTAATVDGGECSAAGLAYLTAGKLKREEKDHNIGGKSSPEGKDTKINWKPFTGRSHVLGNS